MAKANRVHSTPRRTASKIPAAKRRPSRDAGLLDLADRFIAAETEVDRLNDAVNAMEEVMLPGPGKKALPAPRGYEAAKRKMEKANRLARKLEEQIITTPATSMNGVIAKARCVEKNLCDGQSASYDPDAQFAASMAKDLLALSGRGKAVRS
jgi:hypothetical protein